MINLLQDFQKDSIDLHPTWSPRTYRIHGAIHSLLQWKKWTQQLWNLCTYNNCACFHFARIFTWLIYAWSDDWAIAHSLIFINMFWTRNTAEKYTSTLKKHLDSAALCHCFSWVCLLVVQYVYQLEHVNVGVVAWVRYVCMHPYNFRKWLLPPSLSETKLGWWSPPWYSASYSNQNVLGLQPLKNRECWLEIEHAHV
jgi:hypothetical protein